MRKQEQGISLTEILLVVVVVAALMGGSLLLIRQRAHARSKRVTAERIKALEETIAKLVAAHPEGAHPTSDPEDYRGAGGNPVPGHTDEENGTNHGIESLVLAIRHRLVDPLHPLLAEALANLDDDGEFEEITDGWGNPYVYLDGSSYEEDAAGVSAVMADGRVLRVRPLRHVETGEFLHPGAYHLISAGPDEEFGTEDDITN